jgi:hypothetical protein
MLPWRPPRHRPCQSGRSPPAHAVPFGACRGNSPFACTPAGNSRAAIWHTSARTGIADPGTATVPVAGWGTCTCTCTGTGTRLRAGTNLIGTSRQAAVVAAQATLADSHNAARAIFRHCPGRQAGG